MRKIFLGVAGVALALGAGPVWSDCTDTTVVLRSGTPGFTPGNGSSASAVYDPGAANALNALIRGCASGTMTVHLNLGTTEAAGTKDTVKLTRPIEITGRSGKTTALNMLRAPSTTGVIDTLFTFVEGGTDPRLLIDSTNNTLDLTNMAFARKALNATNNTVEIFGKNSRITGCHFWMADKDGRAAGGLLFTAADSVLVERSLFRAPPNGIGYTRAIRSSGVSKHLEIRANVFYSTCVNITSSGPFHLIANTFAGSRNAFNPVIIGSSIGTNFNNAVIMHNLFALKADTLPPIAFAVTLPVSQIAPVDSIVRNAWSQGKPNLPLVAKVPGDSAITLRGSAGANVNLVLPRGASNYGPAAGDVKDYPLTQLRKDSTLARVHPDFGTAYRVILGGGWIPLNMPNIGSVEPRLYFRNFAPFMPSKSWSATARFGAFVDQDTIVVPSPLAAGAQGASLKLQRDTTATGKAKITLLNFDTAYYGQTLPPSLAYFFFSTKLSDLTASNDTSVLKAAGVKFVSKPWTGFDMTLDVPKEVRDGPTVDIYVKMLHFKGQFQAPVPSIAGIGTLSNFPGFPANDLTLKQDVATTNAPNRLMGLAVTRGGEPIDSVRIVTTNAAGQEIQTDDFPVAALTQPLTVTVKTKGTYYFQAYPVASISSGVYKAGPPTEKIGPFDLGISSSDTVHVRLRSSGCPGDGTPATPYCLLKDAMQDVVAKGGGTIIVKNDATPIPLDTLTLNAAGVADTGLITITSGVYNESRPVIRGTAAREALIINRKNVTLRGFTIEQPATGAKPAIAIKAAGCVVEANIFRASTAGAVNAPAVTVEVGAVGDARILNNVVWGYAKGVQLISSASPNVKIMHNTFVSDSSLAAGPTSGISAAGAEDVAAVVANNFFSGLTDPIDASLAGKHPVLDHNVYTEGVDFHGLSESGGLGPSAPVSPKNIWVPKYVDSINIALNDVVDCGSLSPCNPLYAGSSSNGYNVNVAIDAFGNARKNRKEVGAYELRPGPASVLGVVEIKAGLVPGTFRRIHFTVTGKSFDPDSLETDTLFVFWSTTDVTNTLNSSLEQVPANQLKRYPIQQLVDGNITDTAADLKEKTKYWFYAALSRNLTPSQPNSRRLGFPYQDTIVSNPNYLYGNCTFADNKSACPSASGVFGVDTGTWKGRFETRVELALTVDSGLVKLPEFRTITQINQHNLDLSSPLPIFQLFAHVPGLEASQSKQKLTWNIEVVGFVPDLSGLELYRLPEEAGGLPMLVPDWTLDSLSPTRARINFESNVDGAQNYAFGRLQAGLASGSALAADPEPPIYDFDKARDSAVYRIPFKLKGSAFKTGNPLVLVSTIPAGTVIGETGGPGVLTDKYPSKTVVASAGYADLDDAVKAERLYRHYLKAVAADSFAAAPAGQRKPFTLPVLSKSEFAGNTEPAEDDLAVSGGNVPETTLKIPIGKLFKDYLKYADRTGKTTRSIEVVFTVLDGDRIQRTRGFIRTRFRQDDISQTERYDRDEYASSSNAKPHWNLFGYPWDESGSDDLSRIVGQEAWDNSRMRLLAYSGTGEGRAAYSAYDGTNSDAFRYDSGMAVWSGSVRNYSPVCDVGMSLDYQPFKLSLSPNRFYDISLPFNFPMKWQDILDSSGLTAGSLAMWHYNDEEAKWEAVQAASASPPTPGSVLKPWEGYTVKAASSLTLTFPIADTSRTSSPLAKAGADDGSWAAVVEASNATAAMDLRIGRGRRAMTFPEAPDVPGQNFRVSLPDGETGFSQSIKPLAAGWEGHWPLRGAAAKGSGGVALRLASSTREVPIWLVETVHSTLSPLGSDPVKLSESDLQANDYHLVAGNRDYAEGVLRNLLRGNLFTLSNYPNPFAGATLIRYALPPGFARATYTIKVRDFRGRTVWEKTIESGNLLSYLWNGRDRAGRALAAGVYSLSLTAKAEGKPAYRAVKNILRM